VLSDLQRRKSECNFDRGADYSQSTFGVVDNPLKFNGGGAFCSHTTSTFYPLLCS
jgi:hypothetical protein